MQVGNFLADLANAGKLTDKSSNTVIVDTFRFFCSSSWNATVKEIMRALTENKKRRKLRNWCKLV